LHGTLQASFTELSQKLAVHFKDVLWLKRDTHFCR